MTRRVLLLALGLLLALPSLAGAAPPWTKRPRPKGLSYGGTFWVLGAPDLRMEGPYEDRFQLRAGLDARVTYKFAPTASFQLAAKARYELRVGDRVEADLLVDLGDSWFQFRVKKLTVRAGRETLKWGSNALLSPLDRLNPVDLTRAMGGAGLDDPKIPVLAVRATLNLSPVALEAVWLPVFQPQRIAFYGRDFAVFRPGMLEESIPEMVPGTGVGVADDALATAGDRLVDALVDLDPYARDGLQSYLVADLPEEFPWHGDFGGRVGFTGRGVDLDGYVLWHILDRPEVHLSDAIREPLLQNRLPDGAELTQLTNPGAELVNVRYRRALMAGMDATFALGDFVISAEGAFDSRAVHYRKTLEPYLSPDVRYAVEVRYQAGSTFGLTLAAAHHIILRPAADTLMERPHNVTVGLVAVLRLLRDRLQILASTSYAPMWGDLYIHPRITVELQDRVTAVFGVQLFESFRPDVEPGLDSFLATTGGPVGYFRGNDYAYGMVQLAF